MTEIIHCKICGCTNFLNKDIEDQICSNCDNPLKEYLK